MSEFTGAPSTASAGTHPFDEINELETYEPENLAEARNSLPVFEYDQG